MRRSGEANGKKAQNRWGCALEQEKKIGDSQIASRPDTQNAQKKVKKEQKKKHKKWTFKFRGEQWKQQFSSLFCV